MWAWLSPLLSGIGAGKLMDWLSDFFAPKPEKNSGLGVSWSGLALLGAVGVGVWYFIVRRKRAW